MLIRISDSEKEVLDVLWCNPNGMFLAEIISELPKIEKKWESSTIRTFLLRLEEKQMIAIEKKGHLNFYKPIITKKQLAEGKAKALITEYFNGNAKDLIASLIEDNTLSAKEIDDIKEFWDKRKDTI